MGLRSTQCSDALFGSSSQDYVCRSGGPHPATVDIASICTTSKSKMPSGCAGLCAALLSLLHSIPSILALEFVETRLRVLTEQSLIAELKDGCNRILSNALRMPSKSISRVSRYSISIRFSRSSHKDERVSIPLYTVRVARSLDSVCL